MPVPGRLIRDGEYFGHAGDTKGSLASLIGEVELGFAQPNIMKTDFDRSSQEWGEVEAAMHGFLTPIVREFQKAGDKRGVTREERKALGAVCEELAETFRRLQENRLWTGSAAIQDEFAEKGNLPAEPPVPGYSGRRKPGSKSMQEKAGGNGSGEGKRPTGSALLANPEGAVGRMIRLLNKVSGGGLKPPAILDAFDPSMRSGWRTDGGESRLVVNTAFPLYQEFGAVAGYLAETVVMELAKPLEGEEKNVGDYLAEVNTITAAWARIRQRKE